MLKRIPRSVRDVQLQWGKKRDAGVVYYRSTRNTNNPGNWILVISKDLFVAREEFPGEDARREIFKNGSRDVDREEAHYALK